MCSINFIHSELAGKEKLEAAIANMLEVTKHRGPDSSKMYVEDKFGLGINRLEIVGGYKGQQPITDQDKKIFLLCNGEIFNYKSLKRELFPEEKFATTSDCEIILHLYKKFGKDCVNYLEGQFAFVLLDLTRNQILIARDQYGIHPLFYYFDNQNILFASEIKAIFASTLVDNKKFDSYGIAENMFFYGPIPPRTCFKNIRQLLPGHTGTYNFSTRTFKTEDYRKVSKHKTLTGKNIGANGKYKLQRLLAKSIKIRLQGNSSPGVYISGGIDSAIIAHYVKELSERNPVAFSISFSNRNFDEGRYQKIVAETLKMPLIRIKISSKDIIENILNCIRHTETPLIRTAPIPMYLLSQAVKKKNIKFVLCGEGADELFAGYPVFLRGKTSFEEKWLDNKKYLGWFKDQRITRHIKRSFEEMSLPNSLKDNKSLRLKEIDTKLSQYLLSNQGDRMSMAHGIEQRFPYLDSQIAEFAFNLSKKDLFDKDGGKAILRRSFKNVLPKTIVARKKQGYLAPDVSVVTSIIKSGHFNYYFKQSVVESIGIFQYKKISKAIKQILRSNVVPEDDARMLLFVLTTHLLHQEMIAE